jgi:hypothetical protein
VDGYQQTDAAGLSLIEQRFLLAIRHHFRGWHAKIDKDFSERAYKKEITALSGDAVYEAFGFANPAYVLTRLVGRMSISVGRRLGEIYDKIPQIATAARFQLPMEDIVVKVHNKLLLDIRVPYERLSAADRAHAAQVVQQYTAVCTAERSGVGIEVRYNFNPNDSARLRKDKEMAQYLQQDGLLPIYLVFSGISPRDEAIASLGRAGWHFLVGSVATQFMKDLVEMDFQSILCKPAVKAEVAREVGGMMDKMLRSPAFQHAIAEVYVLRSSGGSGATPEQ